MLLCLLFCYINHLKGGEKNEDLLTATKLSWFAHPEILACYLFLTFFSWLFISGHCEAWSSTILLLLVIAKYQHHIALSFYPCSTTGNWRNKKIWKQFPSFQSHNHSCRKSSLGQPECQRKLSSWVGSCHTCKSKGPWSTTFLREASGITLLSSKWVIIIKAHIWPESSLLKKICRRAGIIFFCLPTSAIF